MSDSGKMVGDCEHGMSKNWCVTCLRECVGKSQLLQKQNKELTELCCELQQRVGQLEVLLDRAHMERDVLKERVRELEETVANKV